VNIDHLRLANELRPPDPVQQLVDRYDPVWFQYEGMQKVEFARCEQDRVSGDRHSVSDRVDEQVSNLYR
jgi:hypothetical protein